MMFFETNNRRSPEPPLQACEKTFFTRGKGLSIVIHRLYFLSRDKGDATWEKVCSSASDTFRPTTVADNPPQVNNAKCGLACHTVVKNRDYVFTEYGKRIGSGSSAPVTNVANLAKNHRFEIAHYAVRRSRLREGPAESRWRGGQWLHGQRLSANDRVVCSSRQECKQAGVSASVSL